MVDTALFRYLAHLSSERRNSMAPVRSYTNWNNRSTDNVEPREPYRKYFLFAKGQIQKHGTSAN